MVAIYEANSSPTRRVEPDVQFSCNVDYDPFKYMRQHDLKYGKWRVPTSKTKRCAYTNHSLI